MTIYNLGNIKGEKGDKGDSITGPTGPVGVGIKSIEQITYMKFKFCLTDGSEYVINYGDEPTFDGISVSSSKDILSYADGDSTVLSAQLTNGGQSVSVSGESVTFEVRKQSDDSLVETLTDTTDNTGLASVEYFGKGAGDLNIKVKCRSVIETYEITDAIKYISDTLTSSQTLTIPNIPTNFKATFKAKATRTSFLCIGANSNNLFLFGITGSNGTGTGIFVKENGSYTNIDQDTVLSSNVEYEFEYTYFDGVQTLKVNNHTFTVTNSNIIGRSYVYYDGAGNTGRLSELLITPL